MYTFYHRRQYQKVHLFSQRAISEEYTFYHRRQYQKSTPFITKGNVRKVHLLSQREISEKYTFYHRGQYQKNTSFLTEGNIRKVHLFSQRAISEGAENETARLDQTHRSLRDNKWKVSDGRAMRGLRIIPSFVAINYPLCGWLHSGFHVACAVANIGYQLHEWREETEERGLECWGCAFVWCLNTGVYVGLTFELYIYITILTDTLFGGTWAPFALIIERKSLGGTSPL